MTKRYKRYLKGHSRWGQIFGEMYSHRGTLSVTRKTSVNIKFAYKKQISNTSSFLPKKKNKTKNNPTKTTTTKWNRKPKTEQQTTECQKTTSFSNMTLSWTMKNYINNKKNPKPHSYKNRILIPLFCTLLINK